MNQKYEFTALGDFIDGQFRIPAQPDGEIALEDPGDLSALEGNVPFALSHVDHAVEAARGAYRGWRDLSANERAKHLKRFAAEIEAASSEFSETISRDVGKPLWETRGEVQAMIRKVDLTLDAGLKEVEDREFVMAPGQVARWRHHARGVLGVLGPFNFPGHLVHGHVIPALATGNTVVIKPSESAPMVAQLYVELARHAGLPDGVINLIHGDARSGARLAKHHDLAGVLFTGSYGVGRRILEDTLDQPWKLIALEMGGKNGVAVADDADLDAAAAAIAFGATATAGQRCSATSRVLAMHSIAEELTEKIRRLMSSITVGYALDEAAFMGPLISHAAKQRHADLLGWARNDAAECLLEGGPTEGPYAGHYVRPSLHRVASWDSESRYQAEEHFVPDVCVLSCDSFEEAIAYLDATEYGLSGSVFTKSRPRFEYAFRETRLGLLNWNTSTVGASSALPFGGLGKSGNDRPAAALSSVYCSYPVACVEMEEPTLPTQHPGFPKL